VVQIDFQHVTVKMKLLNEVNQMANLDWVFLKKNGTKEEVTLQGDSPELGDGKMHNDTGFVVKHVISGRTTSLNDIIIAVEH
jgi:hypothetical protein